MRSLHSTVSTGCAAVGLLLAVLLPGAAEAQKKIPCPPDGDHIEIDLKQIAIQYDASSFAGTLSRLSVLGARLEVARKKLQEAAAATQQWNQNCWSVSRQASTVAPSPSNSMMTA
jgi:hypothetical protein